VCGPGSTSRPCRELCRRCGSPEPLPDPILIVEILSPGNEAEIRENVWAYATIPTVSEILLVRLTEIGAELLCRQADGAWPAEPQLIAAADEIALASLDFSGPLAAFYRDTYLAG
jgi:Uma2 family endonuclease